MLFSRARAKKRSDKYTKTSFVGSTFGTSLDRAMIAEWYPLFGGK